MDQLLVPIYIDVAIVPVKLSSCPFIENVNRVGKHLFTWVERMATNLPGVLQMWKNRRGSKSNPFEDNGYEY